MSVAQEVSVSSRRWGVLTRVLHAGVEYATDPRDRRQTIAGNAMSLMFLLATLPYTVFLAFGGGMESSVSAAVSLGYALGPLLASRGHLVAGRATPLIAGLVGMYVLASLMGPGGQVQIAAFFFTGWAFNLFDSRRHAAALVPLALAPGVLFFMIEQGMLLPVERFGSVGAVAAAIPAITVVFAYVLFVVVMFHFYRVNQDNEDALAGSVTRLDAESTARLHALEDARRARDRAEKADAAKTRFLAAMSHELRTPLHAVMGALELIGQDELTRDQEKLANMGRRGSRDLLALIHNVIDFASLEDSGVVVSAARFGLRSLLTDTVEAVRQQVAAKPIEVRLDIDPSVPTHVRGDRGRLHQVLSNLLSNAGKFTDRGHIAVSAIAAPLGADQLRLRVAIEDTGIGVDEALRDAIFERFVQADAGLDRGYDGAGLGLSVCQVVVRAMGGDIEFVPREGGGSIFRFEIVLEAAAVFRSGLVAASESEAAPASANDGPGGHDDARIAHEGRSLPGDGCSVLIAEDNPVNQMIIKSMVKRLGFGDIVLCADGKQAVDAFRRRPFDLVLLDIQMPVMDGIAAVRAIRAFEAETGQSPTPKMAVSANVLPEHIELGLASGFDEYLSKPLELDTLRETIDRLMGLRGQAIPARAQR